MISPSVAGAPASAGQSDFALRVLGKSDQARRRRRIEMVALGVGVPVILLTIWEILTLTGVWDAVFFPAPSAIFMDMVDQVRTAAGLNTLIDDIGVTLRDAAIGFVIGAAGGFIVGMAMGLSRLTFYGLGPVMYGTLPTPKLVLYPMFIIIFGIGIGSTIAICAMGVFYFVCMSTLGGVRFSSTVYRELGTVFGIPRTLRIRRIIAPAALPSVVTGLRLGLGSALVIVLAVEFISSTNGMGVYIWNAWQALQVGQMFAGLLVMLIIGGILVIGGNWLERLAVPWKSDD